MKKGKARMKCILMDTYKIIGENAEAAADYINDQESRMIFAGAGNKYFCDDYVYNIQRFKDAATKKIGVTFKSLI